MGKGAKKKISVLDVVYPDKVQMNIADKIDMHNGGMVRLISALQVLKQTKGNANRKKSGAYKVKHSKTRSEEILDIECGFDIETTKVPVYKDAECIGYQSYMYIWQMVLGNYIITGRTWDEWQLTMFMIQDELNLYSKEWYEPIVTKKGILLDDKGEPVIVKHTDKRQILMWIANSGFEFQFICSHKHNGLSIVEDVFADKARKPIKFGLNFTGKENTDIKSTTLQGAGFVVQDVLRVAGGNLATVAKNYCVTQKAVNDLDYERLRNSQTHLNDKEMGYIYNDVIILHEWAKFYNDVYLKQAKFMPMTSTGIIREAVKYNFKRIDDSPSMRGALTRWINRQQPSTIEEYFKVVTELYRGGYTHANIALVNKVLEKVRGMDFTSSYPAVMLQCKFPVAEFLDENIFTESRVEQFNDMYCKQNQTRVWYADFTFYGVKPKTTHSLENVSKVKEYHECGKSARKYAETYGACIDNGKVLWTSKMSVTLTEQDWNSYKEFYTWDSVEVSNFKSAKAGYLPDYLTSVVKEMYKRKSVLKNQGLDETIEYMIAKAFVNGLYGLTVQKMHFDSEEFMIQPDRIEWLTSHKHFDEQGKEDGCIAGKLQYQELNPFWNMEYWNKCTTKDRALIVLSPYWGVWVTAYARRRIMIAIRALDVDAIYSDTDSVYFTNWDKHKQFFDNWNADIRKMNKKLFGKDYDSLGDLGTFDPVEVKGTDNDGKKCKSVEYSFKTLGAKRYIKWDEYDNIHVTIAGLPKSSLIDASKAYFAEKWEQETGIDASMIDTCIADKHDIVERAIWMFDDRRTVDSKGRPISRMDILKEYSHKTTHFFADRPHEAWVEDYQGHKELMSETSSISIYNIAFSMTLDIEWMNRAKQIQRDGVRIENYQVH